MLRASVSIRPVSTDAVKSFWTLTIIIIVCAVWLSVAGILAEGLFPRFTKAMQVFVILMSFCLLVTWMINAFHRGM
jgi:hypothetical protein